MAYDGEENAGASQVTGSCILERAADVDVWLRNAFEQSTGGIFVMTPDGRTLLFNHAMEALTGWPLDMVCGEPWLDLLFVDNDSHAAGRQLARAVRNAGVAQVEAAIQRRDGSRLWASITLQPLLAPGRTLVLGTAADISDRKRLEAERARVQASLEQAYTDLEVVQDLSELAMATLDLDELFDTVLRRLVETTGAERAVVLLREEDRLVTRASFGLEDQVREAFGMSIGEGFAGIIADTLEPLYMEDAQTDERMLSPFVRREGVVSMYGVPILRRGLEMIGVLLVGWLEYHAQDSREMRLLEIVANRVGSAIYNAVLYGQALRERTLSQAQNHLNAEVISTLDVDEILGHAVRETREALSAAGAGVALVEGGDLVLRYADGTLLPFLTRRTSGELTTALAQTRLSEGALRIPDTRGDLRANADAARELGVGALLGAPLKVRDESLGALIVTWPEAVREFNELDVDFVTQVGTSVSLALQNARLYEVQAGISHKLQEALLAVPETVESLRIGHLYRSATEQAEVGGDFYDVFTVEPDRAVIMIGDVSGHGVEAATLTALCRSVVRAFALEEDRPAEILRKSNEVLLNSSPVNVFVTMFLGIVEMHTGALRYCSAGHPPPLLLHRDPADGTSVVRQLPGVCPLLGAFRTQDFRDHEERLAPGDVLVMFTDGLLEARTADGDFFGSERAARFLAEVGEVDTETLPELLHEEVLRFTGGHLVDDLAILTVAATEVS